MKMVSQNFPRGGKKLLKRNAINPLFRQKTKLKTQKRKAGKSVNKYDGLNTRIVASSAQCLTYTTLTEGMIVLGRVHNSTQYDVSISLPGRLSGLLHVTDISEAYTNLLKSLVSSENPPEEFKPLSELYKRGNYVVCYVKSVNADNKHRVILSVEPEIINQNLSPGKLTQGSKIICSVSSVEDHGYVVDNGNKNLRGFLRTSDVKAGDKYYCGQQIFCAVRSVTIIDNITTVKLTTKPKHLNSLSSSEGEHLDALVPGTKFTVKIKKIFSNGLHITFNGDNIGYINRLYLQNPLDTYVDGSELIATFLYTLPTVKFSYFTEIPLEPELEALEIGNIEKARVLYRDWKGIVLRLKKNTRGFLPFRRTGVDFERIPEKFTPDSTHKCRILTYDNFDRVYICTASKHELTLDHKIPETVALGDIMEVEIIRQNSDNKFLFVKSGKILGDVAPEQICDIDDTEVDLIGKKVLARVLSRDKEGKRFNFTLKKSLIDSDLPILSEFSAAQVGSTYLATVINKSGQGLLLKFYGDLKGVLPSKSLQNIRGGIKAFRVGQVVHVRVTKVIVEGHKLMLELAKEDEKLKICHFTIGETVEGKVIDSSVEGVHIRIPHPYGFGAIIGFLPAGHMSPCKKMGEHMAAHTIPGDTISALVFSMTPEFILTKTLVPQEWYTEIKNLSIGDCIPCSITQIHATGIKVLLPVKDLKSYGIVALNKIDDITILSKHQILFGKIIQINKKTQVVHLTTMLYEVWSSAVINDANDIASLDVLALYLSKLKELSSQRYYQNKPIATLKPGQKVSGIVETVSGSGVVVKLNDGVSGTVRKAHIKKSLKVGDKVNGTVLWVNYIDELVEITLNPVLMNAIKHKQNKIPEDAFKKKLKGEIVLVDEWFILAVVRGYGKGSLVALPTKAHVNDLRPDLSNYKIGATIRCHVIMKDNESEIVPVAYRKEAFVVKKDLIPKRVNSAVQIEDVTEADGEDFERSREMRKEKSKAGDVEGRTERCKVDKKRKHDMIEKISEQITGLAESSEHQTGKVKTQGEAENSESQDEGLREITHKSKKLKKEKQLFAGSNTSQAGEEFAEDLKEIENLEKFKSKIQNPKTSELAQFSIPECGFFWDTNPDTSLLSEEESSDDDEKHEDQPTKKRKKLAPAERRELERQKEREIREKEEAIASNQVPNSAEQFDRLVLASPDSSLVWLQYMAYHLQGTEIEKARSVAKRALKTINFREENEKLNIWQGWLNFEARFGTPETLNNVFQEALKANDIQKIYLHMLKIHGDAGRTAEVEKMVKTITGKFKSLPEVWVECGAALLRNGLKEKSRQTMQRALQSLPAADHVHLMVKFAQLENKFGDKERADTLFEKILMSYPKRVDVWSIYIDTLIKSENYDSARKILERAVIQMLPAKKMKTLFKKFISFEEQHGTPETLAHARELAVKYVENQCSAGDL